MPQLDFFVLINEVNCFTLLFLFFYFFVVYYFFTNLSLILGVRYHFRSLYPHVGIFSTWRDLMISKFEAGDGFELPHVDFLTIVFSQPDRELEYYDLYVCPNLTYTLRLIRKLLEKIGFLYFRFNTFFLNFYYCLIAVTAKDKFENLLFPFYTFGTSVSFDHPLFEDWEQLLKIKD